MDKKSESFDWVYQFKKINEIAADLASITKPNTPLAGYPFALIQSQCRTIPNFSAMEPVTLLNELNDFLDNLIFPEVDLDDYSYVQMGYKIGLLREYINSSIVQAQKEAKRHTDELMVDASDVEKEIDNFSSVLKNIENDLKVIKEKVEVLDKAEELESSIWATIRSSTSISPAGLVVNIDGILFIIDLLRKQFKGSKVNAALVSLYTRMIVERHQPIDGLKHTIGRASATVRKKLSSVRTSIKALQINTVSIVRKAREHGDRVSDVGSVKHKAKGGTTYEGPSIQEKEIEALNFVQFGHLLKKTREAKNISLDQVNYDLNWEKHYFVSMESGMLHQTFSEVRMVRAWLKTYARYLGVDTSKVPYV